MDAAREKQTILVVDDTPENIDILAGILKEFYQVKVALNGEKALKLAISPNPPDLILLDVMMPEMDGYEVCHRLKENDITKNIPVIFVTAKSEIEDETKGFACGAVDYITKPISPPIVIARVKTQFALRNTQSELEMARDKAEEATRAKSDFLAKMSHEIRTPLNGLVANLEFLKLSKINTDQRECVDSAQFCADTLLGIIGDILDLSKIEADKLELEMRPVSLHGVINEVIAMMRHRTEAKNLNLNAFIDPTLPTTILTDSLRFRQVLINLIGNSIKFTEEGGIHLQVLYTKDEKGESWINCKVIDSGAGFAQEKAQQLFEAFSQEDSSTSRVYGGTGLGLTICKRIVEMMGGWICCAGLPGYGAAFEFSAPFEIVEDAPEIRTSDLNEYKILLIDDQSELSSVAKRKFESTSAQIVQLDSIDSGDDEDISCLVVVTNNLDDNNWNEDKRFSSKIPRILISETSNKKWIHQAIKSGFDYFFCDNFDWNLVFYVISNITKTESIEETPLAVDIASLTQDIQNKNIKHPVLVVDDFPMNRQVAKKQLAAFGLECQLAENGREALELATRNSYSLILTDCSMPIMNGFEFTRAYRDWEKENNQRVPIIAMTANALKGDDEKCFAAGMDDYVSKPVTLEQLAGKLIDNLGIERSPVEIQQDTPSIAAEPPVDLKYLEQILGESDPEGLFEMLGYFLEEFEPIMESLQDVINQKDRDQTRDISHKAKGAAGNASAKQLSEIMKDIQLAALEEPWDVILASWDKAQHEYQKVREFILNKR